MRILFISLFILVGTSIRSQVLIIDTATVSKVIFYDDPVYYSMGDLNGPAVSLDFSIINTTDSVFYLYPSTSTFFLEFSFKGKGYVSKEHPLYLVTFFEIEKLALQPGESYHLDFGTSIFLGTNILYKETKDVYDYSIEMLQVLPTIRLTYRDKLSELLSKGIEHVKIVRYEYTSSMGNLPKLKQKAGKARSDKPGTQAK